MNRGLARQPSKVSFHPLADEIGSISYIWNPGIFETYNGKIVTECMKKLPKEKRETQVSSR